MHFKDPLFIRTDKSCAFPEETHIIALWLALRYVSHVDFVLKCVHCGSSFPVEETSLKSSKAAQKKHLLDASTATPQFIKVQEAM